MNDYSSIQDLRTFDDAIFDTVKSYLNENNSSFNENDGLYIYSANLEVTILSKDKADDAANFYPISSLIRTSEETNMLEPDCDATYELANKYIFI